MNSRIFFYTILTMVMSANTQAEKLFTEDFESIGFWESSGSTGVIVPERWDAVRSDPAWAPSTGHSDRHEPIVIGAPYNTDKVYNGASSAVFYRDAKSEPNWKWWSDGILTKDLEAQYNSIYVSFKFRTSTNFDVASISKFMRVSHFDRECGEIYSYHQDGCNGPMAIWMHAINDYGLRNTLALRSHPIATNYYFDKQRIPNLPREMSQGDLSLNYYGNILDLNGSGNFNNKIVDLIDQTTGEPLNREVVMPEHVWGDVWHNIEFYVKINSSPGALDGIMQQWIDGQLVFENKSIPWFSTDSEYLGGWNTVSFGGNDFISKKLSDELRYEDWWAMDDIYIGTERVQPPLPPQNLTAE